MICLVAWKKVENRKVIEGIRSILACVDWNPIIGEKKVLSKSLSLTQLLG